MRRRLDLAASLVGRPRFLNPDEPTTGVDPKSRLELWGMIRALVAEGTTVLLTTQYLEEADRLADEIVVIDHGRVIAAGTPQQLKTRIGGQVLQAQARGQRRPRRDREDPRGARRRRRERPQRRSGHLRPDRRPGGARPRSSAPRRGGHPRRRPVAPPAEPGRGVPRDHRPRRRGGARGPRLDQSGERRTA